jgi:hypothetical protein
MAVAQQVGDLDQRSSTSMTLRQILPGWDASQYTQQQSFSRSVGRDLLVEMNLLLEQVGGMDDEVSDGQTLPRPVVRL